MTFDQAAALAVLAGVVAALIWGRVRSDVVALTGAAVLLACGTVRPAEAQAAFASPALIALASLFVIAYAMELSGLLDTVISAATALCRRLGALGLWLVIGLCGAASALLNNTPIVVLAAPVVRDVATSIGVSPRRFLMPLSYATILGGCCTLIGTSTNLLVNDMARASGQPGFGLFEIAPAALAVAAAGAAYLIIVAPRLLDRPLGSAAASADAAADPGDPGLDDGVGDARVFQPARRFTPWKAYLSLGVFATVICVAALGWAPIAASAFSGAVFLILTRVISPEEAYQGLRPEILLLIAGMVVVGLALELSGLAGLAIEALVALLGGLSPLLSLVLLYGITLVLTEILSNAAVAVLITPLAAALAESLGVSAKPFLVAVMLAASAAFATPFGYQTNVMVFQMGRYSYMDFVRMGLPLNLLTWAVAAIVIPRVFPF